MTEIKWSTIVWAMVVVVLAYALSFPIREVLEVARSAS